jgi:DNA-binding CsgD family transcriptional regulator
LLLLNELNNKQALAYCLNQLGYLALIDSSFQEANKLLFQSLEITKLYNLKPIELQNYIHISKLFKKSNEYLQKAYTLRDSLLKKEKYENLNLIKTKFDFKEIQNDLALKEAELLLVTKDKNIINLQRIILIIILILVIILSIMVYIQVNNKIKIDKIKKMEVEKKLEYKIGEVKNYGLHILKTRKLIDTIKYRINFLKKNLDNYQILRNQIQEILSMLNTSQLLEDDHMQLNRKVEETSRYFSMKLVDSYPDLTDNEKQICVLIRLGFSSKQIALLNKIQPSSVDVSRYRIRKKLNLSNDINLMDFLKSI